MKNTMARPDNRWIRLSCCDLRFFCLLPTAVETTPRCTLMEKTNQPALEFSWKYEQVLLFQWIFMQHCLTDDKLKWNARKELMWDNVRKCYL